MMGDKWGVGVETYFLLSPSRATAFYGKGWGSCLLFSDACSLAGARSTKT